MTEPVVVNEQEDWKAYWSERGQSWRTEPEIDASRQEHLRAALRVTVDIERSIFPFKDTKLSRADVEWLIAESLEIGPQRDARDRLSGGLRCDPLGAAAGRAG